MKKIIIIVLIACMALIGSFLVYGAVKDASISDLELDLSVKKGAIGAFSAKTPANDVILSEIPVFSWTAAENAESYTLEIAATDEFLLTDELYISEKGIETTEFHIMAELKKNQRYYWRVTAKNGDNTKLIDGDCLTFYYEATLFEEIPIDIGYADEWKVHEVGSKATVTLDHEYFFGKDGAEDSLRVSFDSEDTQRGDKYVESNGWVVITRSLESEFYGVDAFYFNFYYAGNDALAFFRLIDEDNEYWYAPIKLAVNSRQVIIIRKEDFVLRTKGTPVMNETFDFNYLKSMELVFEKVDGDGVAYFGNLSAVKYDDYHDYFIDGVDFTQFDESVMKGDSEYFNFSETVDKDKNSMTYSFTVNDGVDDKKKGYGFVKVSIGKILSAGDAFSATFDLSETAGSDYNLIIRLVEEDNDIWTCKIPAIDVPSSGKLLIPFSAFVLADGGFKGDGIKQFYYLKEIQFGLNDCYHAGAITVKDFKLASLAGSVSNLYKTTVAANGMIEDFESYENELDIYYKWQVSTVNKDEAISLHKDLSIGAGNHVASFAYKTDLPEAEYRINFDPVSGFNAISLNAKDNSKDGLATMSVYLYGDVDECYYFTRKVSFKSWKTYTIPLSSFKLTEDSFGSSKIVCNRITGIALAFSYETSNHAYDSGSLVYIDSITFTNTDAKKDSVKSVEVNGKIEMTGNKTMIEDFDDVNPYVHYGVKKKAVDSTNLATNAAAVVTTEVTASGTGGSLELFYKSQMSAPYYIDFLVDSAVEAKGLSFLLKGDDKGAKAEIILEVDSVYYWAKLDLVDGWNLYSIGFDSFLLKTDESKKLSADKVGKITQVSIFLKNYNGDHIESSVYLDEIYLDNSIAVTTNTVTAYAA